MKRILLMITAMPITPTLAVDARSLRPDPHAIRSLTGGIFFG